MFNFANSTDVSQLMVWSDEDSVTNLPINTTTIEKENLSTSTANEAAKVLLQLG